MCEKCGQRKADVALFLSEHAPQLGVRSARAQVAWSELNALAVEMARLPASPPEELHASHQGISQRARKVMEALSLSELEDIHFAAGVLALTGNLHRGDAAGMLRARWRAGERDPQLSPESVSSIEPAVAQEDFTSNLQQQIAGALTQVFTKPVAPGVTVYVPGSGKPVPPS